MLNKKGAMFGLDARIALAIFGALSVISGAVLYSAIQESKVVSYIAKLNELGKAYDAYLLDTGEMLPIISATPVILNIRKLVESSDSLWKGPYINFSVVGVSETELTDGSNGYYILYRPITDWGVSLTADPNIGGPSSCAAAPCFIWVSVKVESLDIAKAIDLKIDGVQNGQKGDIRILDGGAPKYNVYYKYVPALVQPS